MAEYYLQRASCRSDFNRRPLQSNAMGVGYPDTPGIWSEAQVAGWRLVTDAVHSARQPHLPASCGMFGRVSAPLYLDGRDGSSAECCASVRPRQF